ncbi:MAG: OsmC family protein [Flavobacteriales bacterium]|nr:OsmC family protein [Flavobacteriales bacterium]MBK7941623.1 OsmC family protein [Flavobacteriales bacterium]MBK8949353.1 OsmC family protein [Flavobacteriales bacterium]MBK9700166.1 OsmC family protein [Flavobacteriales bacterium]
MEEGRHLAIGARLDGAPYTTRLTMRGHALVADEPVEDGGRDEGPRPHELLCASLASCTLITVRMYADRKGWPLQSLSVEVRMDRTSANGAVATRLDMAVRLDGELDADQRARLMQIAARCPVHRTLLNPIHISIREGA